MSQYGEGSTFSYSTNLLPAIHREAGAVSIGMDQFGSGEPGVPKRVLVADDNEIHKLWSASSCESWVARVEVARTGREAVEAISRTTYDLVVTDCDAGNGRV